MVEILAIIYQKCVYRVVLFTSSHSTHTVAPLESRFPFMVDDPTWGWCGSTRSFPSVRTWKRPGLSPLAQAQRALSLLIHWANHLVGTARISSVALRCGLVGHLNIKANGAELRSSRFQSMHSFNRKPSIKASNHPRSVGFQLSVLSDTCCSLHSEGTFGGS